MLPTPFHSSPFHVWTGPCQGLFSFQNDVLFIMVCQETRGSLALPPARARLRMREITTASATEIQIRPLKGRRTFGAGSGEGGGERGGFWGRTGLTNASWAACQRVPLLSQAADVTSVRGRAERDEAGRGDAGWQVSAVGELEERD